MEKCIYVYSFYEINDTNQHLKNYLTRYNQVFRKFMIIIIGKYYIRFLNIGGVGKHSHLFCYVCGEFMPISKNKTLSDLLTSVTLILTVT